MEKARRVVGKVVVACAVAVLKTLRFALFVVLLVMGRFVRPLLAWTSGAGVLLFLFCALARRDMVEPMWVGAGLAIGAGALAAFYQVLLQWAAPDGAVIVGEV